jgi:ligand-binding sensor domain-containing protein
LQKNNNLTPIIVLALVALTLLATGYISKQPKTDQEPPIYTILNPPDDVTCMVEQNNVLWVGGKAGVIGIDIETHEAFYIDCDERMTYTRHMLLDGDTLWIGHDRGLTRYTQSGYTTLTAGDGMVEDRVNFLMKTSDGTLWAGTWHGAYYYREGEWSRITKDDGLLDNFVNTMIEDNHGGIWYGSYVAPLGGISINMNGEWQYFNTENGLVHNNIVQFFEDEDGSIWASTGLMSVGAAIRFEYRDDKWVIAEVFDNTDGLPLGKIRSVFRDSDGLLWIGSENEGLAVETPNGFKILKMADGLSNDEVKVYYVDPAGNLWLGTRNGITILSRSDIAEIRGS